LKYCCDVAVIGSGFAGSLMAMIARRLGRSVALIEKGKHPRVVIGESSTPLTNLLLEELATRYELPGLLPLTKWGSWQEAYPETGCGLKRGFTFYHHELERPCSLPPARAAQLLVAASPHDRIADTHWYRADFDGLLARQAEESGVDCFEEACLTSISRCERGVALRGTRHGGEFEVSAKFVIDASGPRGFLHRALGIEERELPGYPATEALYNHFSGVGRIDATSFGANEEQPPYPVDDAAVHHVFEGGWAWVLRFNNGLTSAGVAATERVASKLKFAEGEEAWRRLLTAIPVLGEEFAQARPERAFTHLRQISFCSSEVVGENWAMLPSAAGFVDPLLSTGFPLTLLGVMRLAQILEHQWKSERRKDRLRSYADSTQAELLATSRLIAGLYANMGDFQVFSALTLLYFAAASYSETVRRLGKPQLASSFLLHDHPVFGPASRELLGRSMLPRTKAESGRFVAEILRAIEPFDIAGLGDSGRNHWYPVDAADLFESAAKVGATQQDVAELLERCGFAG
jgi:FADH2 O2-dependent halogenase